MTVINETIMNAMNEINSAVYEAPKLPEAEQWEERAACSLSVKLEERLGTKVDGATLLNTLAVSEKQHREFYVPLRLAFDRWGYTVHWSDLKKETLAQVFSEYLHGGAVGSPLTFYHGDRKDLSNFSMGVAQGLTELWLKLED